MSTFEGYGAFNNISSNLSVKKRMTNHSDSVFNPVF